MHWLLQMSFFFIIFAVYFAILCANRYFWANKTILIIWFYFYKSSRSSVP